ncbi:MAG: SDR family oxidoreductase [Candidatus Hydrogenedens sp.]|jgi:3-oxoacyl-[acyl-carrier protein] reductase|nr:SDR family oxidoreductase [Candidatus Hydrogenedens sp.]
MKVPQDKTALVTGAGRGIGRAVSLALAKAGYTLALTARTEEELLSVAKEIQDSGGEAEIFPADLSKESEINALTDQIQSLFPVIDLLVNNAGAAIFKPLWELSIEEWRLSLDTNLTSVFLLTKAFLPVMMERKSGRIINISSVTGLKAIDRQAAYCSAKHGLNGFTKSLALELRPYNIAVHAICPGGVDTRLSREAMPHRDKSNWMTPEDIAQTVLYLVSLSPRAAVDFLSLRRFDSEPLA